MSLRITMPGTRRSWFSSDAILGQLNAIRASLGQTVKPIYLQEPMPFANYDARPVAQGGCGNQQHDSAEGHARGAAQFAKRHGAAAWTFHTRQSFNLGPSSFKAILSLPAHAPRKPSSKPCVARWMLPASRGA